MACSICRAWLAACSTMCSLPCSWQRRNSRLLCEKSACPSTWAVTSTFSARPLLVGEVGVARIAGEHDLEKPRVAHVALDQLVDVAHAEGPVRHAHRQAVHGDLHHEAVGHRLEVDRMEVHARARREILDALHVAAPVACRSADGFTRRASASPGLRFGGEEMPHRAPHTVEIVDRRSSPRAGRWRPHHRTGAPFRSRAAATAPRRLRHSPEKQALVAMSSSATCGRRVIADAVVAVGGIEQIDVVAAGIEARVDDLAHLVQARSRPPCRRCR